MTDMQDLERAVHRMAESVPATSLHARLQYKPLSGECDLIFQGELARYVGRPARITVTTQDGRVQVGEGKYGQLHTADMDIPLNEWIKVEWS